MPRLGFLFIVCLLALPVSTARAEESPYARAYLDRLQENLEALRVQMPAISEAADRAAEGLIDGRGFGVRGDRGLAHELSNRAGAMMNYDGRPGVSGGAGGAGDVILVVVGLRGPANTLLEIGRLKTEGSILIGLGSSDKLSHSDTGKAIIDTCDAWLDNTTSVDGSSLHAPTETVMNAAVAWTFQCELFAAMTRRDRVPVVQQSFEIDTKHRRWRRYAGQRFHHDRWLDPIPPGSLGEAYISSLQNVLCDIGSASWPQLSQAAGRAHQVSIETGSGLWLRPGGRYLPYHVGQDLPDDPDIFRTLTHDGTNPNLRAPGPHDLMLAVGLIETAGSHEWGEPELLRNAGRGVVWIVNGYNSQPEDLTRNELLIDLWGPVGDCVVKVEHYDTRLGPVSGVTAEAVTWMIAAEVAGRNTD